MRNTDIAEKERKIFAQNFNRIMLERGITQANIVEEFGVTASTVSDWANAKKYPRVDKVQMLADYLGVLKSDLTEEKPAVTENDELIELLKNEDVKRIVKKMSQLTPQNLELAIEQLDVLVKHQ